MAPQRNFEIFSIIGGGSAYAPGLVLSLLHHASGLSLKEVRLYDTHHENLETVGRLCQRLSQANGSPFQVRVFDNLGRSLENADVVLNTTRPGGFECRRIDETLPLEFNVPGQETVGPGGFFFALRSVPQALDLARKMERHSPRAILLNYTNPTNIVTQALVQNTSVQVIGLCDQSDEDMEALSLALGVDSLQFTCVGLNHATWYTGLQDSDGKPADLQLAKHPPQSFDEEHRLRFERSGQLAILNPDYWPNSYLAYYYFPQDFVQLSKARGPRTDRIVSRMPFYHDHFKTEALKERPDVKHHRGSHGFGDMAVRVLLALSGKPEKDLVLNLPNSEKGSSPFSSKTVVENKVRFNGGKYSCKPIPSPSPPASALGLLERLEQYQLAASQAATLPDGRNLVEALTLNPLVSNRQQAERMIIHAQRAYGNHIEAFK